MSSSPPLPPLPDGLIAEILAKLGRHNHLMREFIRLDPAIMPVAIRRGDNQDQLSIGDDNHNNSNTDSNNHAASTTNLPNNNNLNSSTAYDASLHEYIYSNITEAPNGTQCDVWDPRFLLLINHKLHNLTSLHLIIDFFRIQSYSDPSTKNFVIEGLIGALANSIMMAKLEALSLYFGERDFTIKNLIPKPISLPSLTTLDLSLNEMTPEHFVHLAHNLECPRLKRIKVATRWLEDERMVAAIEMFLGFDDEKNIVDDPTNQEEKNGKKYTSSSPSKKTHFTHLDIASGPYNSSFSDKTIEVLTKSPLLRYIGDFTLKGRSESEVMKLFSSRFAPISGTITSLNMSRVTMTPFYIPFLTQSTAMAGLTSLDLTNCALDDEMMGKISKSPFLNKIETLSLCSNPSLSDASILKLTQSPSFSNLKTLSLASCKGLTTKSLRYIGESEVLKGLECLGLPPLKDLTGDENHENFSIFINSPNLLHLKVFLLQEVTISAETIRTIASSRALCGLEALGISWCKIAGNVGQGANVGDDGDNYFNPAPNADPFGLFRDRGGHDSDEDEGGSDEEDEGDEGSAENGTNDDCVGELLTSPYLSNLTALTLSKLPLLKNRHLEILAQSPTMANLRELSISWNEQITNRGVQFLFQPDQFSQGEGKKFQTDQKNPKNDKNQLFCEENFLKKLKVLNLSDCWKLNDRIIKYLIKNNIRMVGQFEKLLVDNTEMEDYEEFLRKCGWWDGDFE